VALSVDVHAPRLILVPLGQRADAMVGEELVLIEHLLEDADEAVLVREREEATLATAANYTSKSDLVRI
jgi:hypothetical protein